MSTKGDQLPEVRIDRPKSMAVSGEPQAGAAGCKLTRHPGFARHFKSIRYFSIGGAALFLVYAVIQARVQSAHARPSLDTERMRALAQTSSLLSASAATAATATDASLSAGPMGANASREVQSRFKKLSGSEPDGAQMPAIGRDASAYPGFATTTSKTPTPPLHVRPVPLIIEGSMLSPGDGDGLSGVTVHASLRVFDDRNAPLSLLAIRYEDATPLALMQVAVNGTGKSTPTAWLPVGGIPAPGWQILEISSSSALLITPLGNPLRLHLGVSQVMLPSAASRGPVVQPTPVGDRQGRGN